MVTALLGLAVALVPIVVVVWVTTHAARAWLALSRLLRHPTTPLGDARDGYVEVEGWLRASGEPIVAPSGARCAALRVVATRVENEPGSKKRLHAAPATVVRLTRCTLEDDRGARVELGPETSLSVQGDAWESGEEPVEALDLAWRDELVDGPATHVVIEEHRIADGARVVIHALAEPGAGGASPYRGVLTRLAPPLDEPMLLWSGSERTARRRAAWLAVAMAIAVAALFDVAIQVLLFARG